MVTAEDIKKLREATKSNGGIAPDEAVRAVTNKISSVAKERNSIEYKTAQLPDFREYVQKGRDIYNIQHTGHMAVTQGEADTYSYLLGKEGKKSADKYLKSIQKKMNERSAADEAAKIRAMSDASKAKAIGYNMLGGVLGGIGLAANAAQAAKNKITGRNDAADVNSPSYFGARAQNISEDSLTEGQNGVERFLTTTALSMGQNLTQRAVTGNNKAAGLALMAANAAGRKSYENAQKGIDAGTGMKSALVAGAIEAASENMAWGSLDKILGAGFASGKDIGKNILKQAISEGGEEAAAEVLGNLSDIAQLGDASDFAIYKKSLTDNGMSEAKANTLAIAKFFGANTAIAAAGGALSGGVFGAGGSFVGGRTVTQTGAQIRSQEGANEQIDADVARARSGAYGKAVQSAADDYMKGKNSTAELSDRQVGSLYALISEHDSDVYKKLERAQKTARAAQKAAKAMDNVQNTAAAVKDSMTASFDALVGRLKSGQTGTAQDTAAQTGTVQNTAAQTGTLQDTAAQTGTVQNTAAQTGTAEYKNKATEQQMGTARSHDPNVRNASADVAFDKYSVSQSSPEVNGQNAVEYLTDADTEEYMRTGNTHTRNVKAELANNDVKPILTSKAETDDFIDKSIKGEIGSTIKAFAKVNSRLADDISEMSNGETDVSGYYLELNSDDIRHSSMRHSQETESGQKSLTHDEILNIPEYIMNYDDVLEIEEKKDGRKRIVLGKKINGHSIIINVVSKARKGLAYKSAYILDTEKYEQKFPQTKKAGYRKATASQDETMPRTSETVPAPASANADFREATAPQSETMPKRLNNDPTTAFDNEIISQNADVVNGREQAAERFRYDETLTEEQRASADAAERITGHRYNMSAQPNTENERFVSEVAGLYGLKTVFFDGSDNGFASGDTVFLNRNSEDGIRRVFGHEAVHTLSAKAKAELINTLRSMRPSGKAYVRNTAAASAGSVGGQTRTEFDSLYEEIKELYSSRTGEAVSDEYILEEYLANIGGELWDNQEFAKRAARGDATLIENMVRAIRDFCASIKNRVLYGDAYGGLRGQYIESVTDMERMADALEKALREARANAANDKADGGVRFDMRRDSSGREYWNVDTKQDIFKNIKGVSNLKKAAYNYILNGARGTEVEGTIDGETVVFNRIGAKEYVYGRQSQILDDEMGARGTALKMRTAPSIEDLIENAPIKWHAPDAKNHKQFPNGFDNYRGRVRIDDTMFDYVVRVGNASDKSVFYDVNLTPETNNNGNEKPKGLGQTSTPHKNKNVSLPLNTMVSQNSGNVNTQNAEFSKNQRVEWRAGGQAHEGVIEDTFTRNNTQFVRVRGEDGNAYDVNRRFVKAAADDSNGDGTKIKFSLSTPVEQTKDIVALHNLNEDKLKGALELGGFPMPSIAVTKTNMSHDKFGDITLLFSRDTIDPEMNSDNRVYGGDAYTPMFPSVVNKPNETAVQALADRLGTSYAMLEDNYFANKTTEQAQQQMQNSHEAREAFVREKGLTVEPVLHEPKMNKNYHNADNVREFIKSHSYHDIVNDPSVREEYINEIVKNKFARMKEKYREKINQELDFAKNEDALFTELEKQYNEDRAIAEGNGALVEDEYSYSEGLDNLIQEHKSEFDAYVHELVSGVMGEKYIENGKDPYTASGNRRSFDQLHDKYTLDNIVKKMKSELETGQSSLFTGSANVRGAAVERYSSVEQMKADSGRLSVTSEEEADSIRNEFSDRLAAIVEKAVEGRNASYYSALDDFSNIIIEALNKTKNSMQFAKYLRNYDNIYNITPEIVSDIRSLIADMRKAPVMYFEAKPRRAVGFDEVKAAIVPEGTSEEVRAALAEQGINVLEYKGGDSSDRLEKLNSASEDIRFSLSQNDSKNAINAQDVQAVQSIGRKSVNDFTSEDIAQTEVFARKYFDEMGEKSPFFRAWFGDWRANDTTPVHIVTEQGSVRGTEKNLDTGWDIQISGKLFNETKAHGGPMNRGGVPYLDYINSIVKNAVLLDSYTIGKAKSENSAMMHSLYAIADMGNGEELVKLYVEEMRNPNTNNTDKRSYQLQLISKQQLRAKGSVSNNSLSPVRSAAVGYSVSDLFAIVKENDKNFSPKESSKVVNEDGTPRVMYRGGNEQFTIFDRKKSRSSNLYGRGFYFTDSRSHAAQYGDVSSYYLDVKNPLGNTHSITKAQLRAFLEAVAENEDDYDIWNYGTEDIDEICDSIYGKSDFDMIQDISVTAIGDLVEAAELFNSVNGTNYDGFILPTETVVFNSNQIKSATENIGTFNANDPDIRFSLSRNDSGKIDRYTYDALVQKADMPVTELTESVPRTADGKLDRKAIRQSAAQNVRSQNNPSNTENTSFVYVRDIDKNIVVGAKGLEHGLTRKADATARVTMQIGDILKNAVAVNELKPRKGSDGGYVLVGIGYDSATDSYYPTRVVVHNFEVDDIEPLGSVYAVLGKEKRASSQKGRGNIGNPTTPIKGSYAITIADFLDDVKTYFPDILPNDVLNHYSMTRPETKLSGSVRFDLAGKGSKEQYEMNNRRRAAIADIAKAVSDKLGLESIDETDRAELAALAEDIYSDFIESNFSEQSFENAQNRLRERIEEMVRENSETVADKTMYDKYAELRSYLRTTPMKIEEDLKGDWGSKKEFNEFRKSNFGRIRISAGGRAVDSVYHELAGMYPEFFDESEHTTQSDQLMHMAEVADQLRPTVRSEYGEDEVHMVSDGLASEMLTELYGLFGEEYAEESRENEHTPEQLKVMREYEDAVDEDMKRFIDRVRNGENTKYEYKVGGTTARFNQDIQKKLGIDVAGYSHYIAPDAITHIDNRHGETGRADNSMADIKDIQRVGYVIENYDELYDLKKRSRKYKDKNNESAPEIALLKRIDGSYIIVEAIPESSQKRVHIVSVYKTKADKVPHELFRSLGITSENELYPTFNSSVSQQQSDVNTQNQERGSAQPISQYYTNTMERADIFSPEILKRTKPSDFAYEPQTAQEWHDEAVRRLGTDFEGAKKELESKEAFTSGADTHTAALIAQTYIDKYSKSADSSDLARLMSWLIKTASKTRETARALAGARSAYPKTGAGMLSEAARTIDRRQQAADEKNPRRKRRREQQVSETIREIEKKEQDGVEEVIRRTRERIERTRPEREGRKRAARRERTSAEMRDEFRRRLKESLDAGEQTEGENEFNNDEVISNITNDLFGNIEQEIALDEVRSEIGMNFSMSETQWRQELKKALAGRGKYAEVLKRAKAIALEMYSSDSAAIAGIERYFSEAKLPEIPLGAVNYGVNKSIDELGTELDDLIRAYFSSDDHAKGPLMDNLRAQLGISESESADLAGFINENYKELVRERVLEGLEKRFKDKRELGSVGQRMLQGRRERINKAVSELLSKERIGELYKRVFDSLDGGESENVQRSRARLIQAVKERNIDLTEIAAMGVTEDDRSMRARMEELFDGVDGITEYDLDSLRGAVYRSFAAMPEVRHNRLLRQFYTADKLTGAVTVRNITHDANYQRLYDIARAKGDTREMMLSDFLKEQEGIPTLTEYDINRILNLMNKAEGLDEDSSERETLERAARRAAASAGEISNADKVRAYMRINMLLNPRTTIFRNAGGNLIMTPVNAVRDIVGTGIDKALSKRYGTQRTQMMPQVGAAMKGAAEGARAAVNDFKTGTDSRSYEGRYENQGAVRAFENSEGVGKGAVKAATRAIARGIDKADRMTSFLLDLGDRPFYQAYYNDVLAQLMKADGNSEPTDIQTSIAEAVALDRTWQNDTWATEVGKKFKNSLNSVSDVIYEKVSDMTGRDIHFAGLGDVILPFVKTPANLTRAAIQYSPLGFIEAAGEFVAFKNAIKTGREVRYVQRQLVDKLSKAMVGAVIWMLGRALAAMGIYNDDPDAEGDDYRIKKFRQEVEGIQSGSFTFGKYNYSADWLQPLGETLTGGAAYKHSRMNGENVLNSFLHAMGSSAKVIINASFLKALKELMERDTDEFAETVLDIAANSVNQSLPLASIQRQAAHAFDNTKRSSYSPSMPMGYAKQTAATIPGVSRTLEPRLDPFGEEVKWSPDTVAEGANIGNLAARGFNSFFNPANVTRVKESDVTREIERLYRVTGDSGVFPRTALKSVTYDEAHKLTSKQYTKFQRIMGNKIRDDMTAVMQSGDVGTIAEVTTEEELRYKDIKGDEALLKSVESGIARSAGNEYMKTVGKSKVEELTESEKEKRKRIIEEAKSKFRSGETSYKKNMSASDGKAWSELSDDVRAEVFKKIISNGEKYAKEQMREEVEGK